MNLDREGHSLVKAAAIGRLLHLNGSSALVRALNATLARALVYYQERVGCGAAQLEKAVKDVEDDLFKSNVGDNG